MRKLIKSILVVGIFVILFTITFYYPKEILMEVDGFKYSLGMDNIEFEQQGGF
ncbi:MAG: hypothetical protein NAG76_18630 [Candidatus Pristimantibacillus lignocellulolyticus]|uniref:Uncharacterized protein n=1 Tax=Candidatus Pristimantibacillus lignocellulolyticus TaxID=2994561 RepID=A0A9J6ZD33_9BACL|nr:MAG: hypothetical protein NAG76_18630 [Candidatus Pristimantibacillus lignocellulolyticus]